jgi:hypothetical protein
VFWPRKAPGRAVAGAPYAGLLSVAWAYVEKVRTQFLSLRQLAPQPRVLCVEMLAISPVFAAISDLDSGPLNGGARPFFSEWLNSLPSSGLRGFGTVLEIPTFRRAYEFQRKEVLRLLSDRREHPNPIRHIEVRILPPQPGSSELGENVCDRRRKPANGGFLRIRHRSQAPVSVILRTKCPLVSSEHLKNSRFWETAAGDPVRSAVSGPAYGVRLQLNFPAQRVACSSGGDILGPPQGGQRRHAHGRARRMPASLL